MLVVNYFYNESIIFCAGWFCEFQKNFFCSSALSISYEHLVRYMTVNSPSFIQQTLGFIVHRNDTMTVTVKNATKITWRTMQRFISVMHISFCTNSVSRISIYSAIQNSYFQVHYILPLLTKCCSLKFKND